MKVLSVIAENYVVLFELIGLLIMLGISAHTSRRIKRLTVTVIVLMLIEMIVFKTEAWTADLDRLTVARPLLTATEYSLYPFILYVTTMITTQKRLSWKTNLLLLSPAIAVIPVYYTSQWTKLVCYFSEENHYLGGPLNYLPYIVFAVYIVLFLVRNLIFTRSEPLRLRLIAYYLLATPTLGVLFYIKTDFSSDYTGLFTAAIILYYLFVYLHLSRIDPLTSLLNRQSYYLDIDVDGSRIEYVVSIDMNELKSINDNHGHDAGDKALVTVAGVLKKNVGNNASLYRIGGDEFVVFCRTADETAVERMIGSMRSQMAETPYSCAFGYAKKEPNESVDDAVRVADQKMYDDKVRIKGTPGRDGEPPAL